MLLLIPILYEDAPNQMRNEPQRTHRHVRVGGASRREASPRVVASRRVGHKERRSQENLAQPHKEAPR